MIHLMGSNKRLCDGFSRRDLLHIGGLATLGLTVEDLFRSQALSAEKQSHSSSFGRSKSCILLFLFGSPPQHETFDPKPDAPEDIRGEMNAISTQLPGLQIGEGLPQTAEIMDRITLVRSMTHPYALHGVAYALTGMPTYTPTIEAIPRHPDHYPFIGSVVDYIEAHRSGSAHPSLPRNIGLPWLFGAKSTLGALAGPYPAFLGNGYDPLWTDFTGAGKRVVPKLLDEQTDDVLDPFASTTSDGRFKLPATGLPGGVTKSRFDVRRTLLHQFDQTRRWMEQYRNVQSFDHHQNTAYSLVTSNKMREALDIHRESEGSRDRYGMNLFGQSSLAARRLVESGAKFVSVFWDPFGPFGGSVWDTHANHFPRLKEYLLPVFDQAYSALIRDLDQRGLLDETLVLCVSEHGRTPKIDSKPKGAGRHHWSRAYSATLAGGGVKRGNVVGQSDPIGGDVAQTPVSPKDLLATSYHLLGIDPDTIIHDQVNRPIRIAGDGKIRPELLS